ncbi:hypothetical protein ABPG75_006791 [Micractinium tetrahymenae]
MEPFTLLAQLQAQREPPGFGPGPVPPAGAPSAGTALAPLMAAEEQEHALRQYFRSRPTSELLSLLQLRDAAGQAAIHRAAASGDIPQLAGLLAADPTLVRLRDGNGRLPLAAAAAGLQPLAASLLLQAYGAGSAPFWDAARALLRAGAAVRRPPPAPQPLHALALGLAQPTHPAAPAAPAEVLSVAHLLVQGGARLDDVPVFDNDALTTGPGLSGTPALAFLCGAAPAAGAGSQQALLSLVDALLHWGAAPNARDVRGNTPLHRLAGALHEPQQAAEQGSPPFLPLLHRLGSGGADLEALNDAQLTPLAVLLRQGCHANCIRRATVEAARELLRAGASLARAGGCQALYPVLTAALLTAQAPYQIDTKRALTRELMELLLAAPGPALINDLGFQGMPPLAHLLEAALSRLLEEASDSMEVGLAKWQLSPLTRERLSELVQLLLAKGADANTLDPGRAADSAAALWAVWEEDEASDDEDLLSDDELDDEPVEAVELRRRRRQWCMRRLISRLEVSGACQAPLRQSVKLHDVALTRALLAAGAAAGGGLGRPLLQDVEAEFSVLTWMTTLRQDQRKPVLCWLLDTAEALLAAGCPPHVGAGFEVAAPWSYRWLRLLNLQLAGQPWSPREHRAFPAPFRAAVRTLLLINCCRGFAAASSSSSSSGGSGPGDCWVEAGGGSKRHAGDGCPAHPFGSLPSPRGGLLAGGSEMPGPSSRPAGPGLEHGPSTVGVRADPAGRLIFTLSVPRPNGGSGIAAGSSSTVVKSRPGPASRPAGRGIYLPPELVQRILALAAAPVSGWVAMLPAASF